MGQFFIKTLKSQKVNNFSRIHRVDMTARCFEKTAARRFDMKAAHRFDMKDVCAKVPR